MKETGRIKQQVPKSKHVPRGGGGSQCVITSECVAPLPFKIVLCATPTLWFPLSCYCGSPSVSTWIHSRICGLERLGSRRGRLATPRVARIRHLVCQFWTTCCAAAIPNLLCGPLLLLLLLHTAADPTQPQTAAFFLSLLSCRWRRMKKWFDLSSGDTEMKLGIAASLSAFTIWRGFLWSLGSPTVDFFFKSPSF